MSNEERFNMLRGMIMSSLADNGTKKELLAFLRELEQKEKE